MGGCFTRAVRLMRLTLAVLVALAIACAAPASRAGFGVPPPFTPSAPPDSTTDPPATHYSRLDRSGCEAELARRAVPFERVEEARGVLAPVRLLGPLHGVTYRTALPATQRASSPLEIMDCRLGLALDDFAAQLATHDVVEVVHYSMYRPPRTTWPPARVASRHPGGLAIDVASFVKKGGQILQVERDFHGRIGAPTCGPHAAPYPATPEATELRGILCDAASAKIFNIALSPDFNWAHRNHFHLEVATGGKFFLVH
jgi:hypothetical protein